MRKTKVIEIVNLEEVTMEIGRIETITLPPLTSPNVTLPLAELRE